MFMCVLGNLSDKKEEEEKKEVSSVKDGKKMSNVL